jgi:hypothetical protein
MTTQDLLAAPQAAKVAMSTADLLKREADDRRKAEEAAAAIVAAFANDEELVAACGKRLDVFAPACLKIRTKQGGKLWPFVLNHIQILYLQGLRELFTGGKGDYFRGCRDLIVKPRQLGFSTFIAALFFMDGLLEPGRISVIVTHDEKISKELLRTYRLFYEELPEQLRVGTTLRTAAANVYEIAFDGVPEVSRFEIRTEKGTEWRGGTIHNLHASEAAFYERWPDFFASYVQAVPMSGNIIFETTCNGRNDYYDEVMKALEPGSGSEYRVVFYEWFKHPEYRRPWNELAEKPITKEEQALMDLHGLDKEQIAWRRWKRAEVKEKFQQEYPETLLGAFLATGRPFFDTESVDRGHERAKAVAARWASGEDQGPRFPRAFVTIYEDPIPGELYILAADIAEGVDKGTGDGEKGGADWSDAVMLKASTLQEVASIRGRMSPVEYAEILNRLGRLYQAVIAPERNNHGHTVVAALQRAEYPELYHHLEYNEDGKSYLKAGWPTNVTTRPMMLDALDTAIRRDAFRSYDTGFWREADRFVRNPKTGKPEAMSGWHDDRIISRSIACYLATIGRTAWGLEGNAGRDAAGFPRTPESYGGNPSTVRPSRADHIIEVAHKVMKREGIPIPEAPKPKPTLAAMREAREEAKPVDRFAQHPKAPGVVPTNAAAARMAVEALDELRERKKKVCASCESCTTLGSGHWCSTLRMRIIDTDPACNSHRLPEAEDITSELDSDFGGEKWT